MPWRYQPVFTIDEAGPAYTLVEAIFDKDGNFEAWAEGDALPMGESQDELVHDLQRMLVDAVAWEPVLLSELKPGCKFTPRVSMEDRKGIADDIDEMTLAMDRRVALKPVAN